MNVSSAPPAGIAAIRRRYLRMATSAAAIDIVFSMVFVVLNGAWSFAPFSIAIGLVLMLSVNFLIARRLFEPIRHYLEGRTGFESVQRRLTQLPLFTAVSVGLLAGVATLARVLLGYFGPHAWIRGVPPSTLADSVTIGIVIPAFYFTYAYFVASDYLAGLCTFIFHHRGRNLELFFGSYVTKLVVALVVISIAPLATIVVDLLSYSGERLQIEIATDVAIAAMGVAISCHFIGRSMLLPVRIVSGAMGRVAGGDLDIRVPVTSNDEVGELTGRFNTMVEGLRERERIRETFGRYVDESVATAILRRQGEGAPKGETGEATILFTDIAGFTTIAEYLQPDELVAALNDYLETVLAPIREHGGVVNTFIGDGLFASFNMPLACPDHAAAAVRAAIDIQRAVNSRTFGAQGVAFATRVGISTGHVIGGEVGAGKRMTFTLLGDTVNLAARLEELNKQHGTRILVSESTRAACGDRFAFAALGAVEVRGRSEQSTIFSLDPTLQERPQ